MLRQGGTSPSTSSPSHPPDQRTSRTRFGLRTVFKTKAARNVSLMLVRLFSTLGSEFKLNIDGHRYWLSQEGYTITLVPSLRHGPQAARQHRSTTQPILCTILLLLSQFRHLPQPLSILTCKKLRPPLQCHPHHYLSGARLIPLVTPWCIFA